MRELSVMVCSGCCFAVVNNGQSKHWRGLVIFLMYFWTKSKR